MKTKVLCVHVIAAACGIWIIKLRKPCVHCAFYSKCVKNKKKNIEFFLLELVSPLEKISLALKIAACIPYRFGDASSSLQDY